MWTQTTRSKLKARIKAAIRQIPRDINMNWIQQNQKNREYLIVQLFKSTLQLRMDELFLQEEFNAMRPFFTVRASLNPSLKFKPQNIHFSENFERHTVTLLFPHFKEPREIIYKTL